LSELSEQHPRAFRSLKSEPGLMADALALAAWSPLLSTTLLQNPDYLSWLNRERSNSRVRTCDELRESLARFALMNSSLNPQILLARFRRREPPHPAQRAAGRASRRGAAQALLRQCSEQFS